MASLEERLQDSNYVNWLKVTYALTRLKNGLGCVTSRIMSDFQEEIKNQYNIVKSCESVSCSSQSIKNQGVDKFVCPSGVCNNFLQRIAAEHINKKMIFWENCNVRSWPENCWEIAKAYMPRGCRSNTGPTVTDCAGLLQLIHNCKLFKEKLRLKPDATQKVKMAFYVSYFVS